MPAGSTRRMAFNNHSLNIKTLSLCGIDQQTSSCLQHFPSLTELHVWCPVYYYQWVRDEFIRNIANCPHLANICFHEIESNQFVREQNEGEKKRALLARLAELSISTSVVLFSGAVRDNI